ncbi:alpha/beta-Hydrolases superfamily protein isoform X2 [Tasmannia lanceolata]|uniref:alpha/beta-Hydrolases superfamily protein isoform X2 n=1 Tax=Tasmannia lanceolata TaxID=3420 RepID=UPI004063F3AC
MEQLVNFIIRPPRADYSPKNDLLDKEFLLKGQWFQRKDLKIINSRGDVLQCSHYMPLIIPGEKALPCVIYCHGNSGCRADASEAAIMLLPACITVFALDFSGSGLSEGEHVTLGWNEKDDLKAVVNHLRSEGNVSCIGLWGRSMGAVTSLMYGAEDPSIAGMVLDSPFSNLVDLMMELVDTYGIRLPKFTVKFAIQYMRKVISRKAKFDIMDLDAIKVAKCCFVPVLLGHAINDDFIRPHHSDRIYDSYAGEKNIIKFEGDHNSPRSQFYFDSITIFFHNVLNPPKDVFAENLFPTIHNYLDKDKWDIKHEEGYMNLTPVDSLKGITKDDANPQRPIRPMSRIEVLADISSQVKLSGAEEKGFERDLGSSSSRLFTFDFPNGHSSSALDPTIIDGEYVEYPFDIIADFPSNSEDEERMFMEAVLESLKDLEIRHPEGDDEPSHPSNLPANSSQENDSDASTSHCTGSTEIVASSKSASNGEHLSTDTSLSSETTFGQPVLFAKSTGVGNAANGDMSTSVGSSSNGDKSEHDVDGTGGTVSTLTTKKNPASLVKDGLVHRWGLNFFRNTG